MSKTVAAVFALALITGCDAGGKNRDNEDNKSGTGRINAADGGVIRLNDEITFTIPPESLSQDANIRIERITNVPAGGMEGFSSIGQADLFPPTGMQLGTVALLSSFMKNLHSLVIFH